MNMIIKIAVPSDDRATITVPHNAKFLDPWLGALIFRDLPDNVVHTRDIDEIKTVGIFTD